MKPLRVSFATRTEDLVVMTTWGQVSRAIVRPQRLVWKYYVSRGGNNTMSSHSKEQSLLSCANDIKILTPAKAGADGTFRTKT